MKRLLLDGLAAYRITRLITADRITRRPREYLIQSSYGVMLDSKSLDFLGDEEAWRESGALDELVFEDEDPPLLAYLVTCPVCVGLYVGAVVVGARRLLPKAWGIAAEALAVASIPSIIEQVMSD